MEEDALWDILLEAGLTEEQIEEVMQLGALQGEGQMAQSQYEQAQQLRRTPWPKGRWTGRVYRQAHPLEHISAGVDRVVGSMQSEKQLKRQEQILQDQSRLRAAMLRGMMGGNQQNPPAAPPMGAMSPAPVGTGNPMTEALRRIDPYQLR